MRSAPLLVAAVPTVRVEGTAVPTVRVEVTAVPTVRVEGTAQPATDMYRLPSHFQKPGGQL